MKQISKQTRANGKKKDNGTYEKAAIMKTVRVTPIKESPQPT